MKRLIVFGNTPPGHYTAIRVDSKATFSKTLLQSLQLIFSGLFIPLAWLIKTPISLLVRPLTWEEKKEFLLAHYEKIKDQGYSVSSRPEKEKP